jgi:hypothetical protein
MVQILKQTYRACIAQLSRVYMASIATHRPINAALKV